MKNTSKTRLTLTALSCLTALAIPSFADSVTTNRDTDKPLHNNAAVRSTDHAVGAKLARADHKFVKKAAACGDYELAISRQASTQATNTQVRAYAADLVRSHERMNKELHTLAARRGVTLAVENKHHDDVTDLSKQTGGDYDEAYLDDIIDSHEDAIDLLEKASKSKDSDIAAFAVNHLPTMRDHLARAKQLDKAID